MTQCAAQSKRTGKQCRQSAMHGASVCYHHGGKTPKGIASPNFQTGRYSKYLPARLMERYTEAAGDEELLNLRHDIALLDTRLAEVLSKVDSGESGHLWAAMKAAKGELLTAKLKNDNKGVNAAMSTLLSLIDEGLADTAAWNEIQGLIEQRRKLVESERKRLVEMQQVITSEQAMTLISALLNSVRRNVTDRTALAAIQADFVQFANVGNK